MNEFPTPTRVDWFTPRQSTAMAMGCSPASPHHLIHPPRLRDADHHAPPPGRGSPLGLAVCPWHPRRRVRTWRRLPAAGDALDQYAARRTQYRRIGSRTAHLRGQGARRRRGRQAGAAGTLGHSGGVHHSWRPRTRVPVPDRLGALDLSYRHNHRSSTKDALLAIVRYGVEAGAGPSGRPPGPWA